MKKRKPHKGGSTTVEAAFFKDSATKVKQRKNESLLDTKSKVEPLKLEKLEGFEQARIAEAKAMKKIASSSNHLGSTH